MSCSSQQNVQKGTIGNVAIVTLTTAGGSRVDADALPTVVGMHVNGVAVDPTTVAYAVAITQEQDQTPAVITGRYSLEFDSTPFAKGDQIEFDVAAVIGGVTVNTIKSVIITDDPAERPSVC